MMIKKPQTRKLRFYYFVSALIAVGVGSFVFWHNNALYYSTDLLQDFSSIKVITPFLNESQYAVFYNIYGDPQQNNTSFFETIVLEQIQQIGQSHAVSINTKLELYYNTVGHAYLKGAAFTQTMQDTCHALGLVCRHMAHYEQGFEEITLQDAYRFCRQYPDRHIIYLHNKGSYNGGKRREKWRRHMTRAITDKLCLDRMDQCSTCGLLFQPIWTLFYPGNFFVAQCEYVQQLIAPNEFAVHTEAMLAKRPREIRGTIFAEKRDTRGEARFATEHWIGSHPSIVPCHLSTHADLRVWMDRPKVPFQFMTASELPLASKWILSDMQRTQKVLQDKSSRSRDAYLLAGLLWKWQSFYQQYPPMDSWIWDYFPDGHEWRGRVYSNDTVLQALRGAWQETPESSVWLELIRRKE